MLVFEDIIVLSLTPDLYNLNSIPIFSGDHGNGKSVNGSVLLKHPKPS